VLLRFTDRAGVFFALQSSVLYAPTVVEDGMSIRDLATHAACYVTVGDLAEYWAVSRQQIYKRIESGALESIRLSSRLYRIRTSAALDYERRVSINGAWREKLSQPTTLSAAQGATLPTKIGPHRVLRKFSAGTE
jgi:excisionase family DNA binding protein